MVNPIISSRNAPALPHLRQHDPVLKQVIDAVTPLSFDLSGDVYHDLVSCVADQQIPTLPVDTYSGTLLVVAVLPKTPTSVLHLSGRANSTDCCGRTRGLRSSVVAGVRLEHAHRNWCVCYRLCATVDI